MAVKHPDFPHISVYSLPSAEAPKRGAFYAVRKGDTLSSIVSSLTKTGQWPNATTGNIIAAINNSQWNRSNCIYRVDSSSCTSKRTTSGGYLSLCQGDAKGSAVTLGSKYPVIWIPSAEYVNPSDVPVPSTPSTPVAPGVDPIVSPLAPVEPEKKSNMVLWIGIAVAVVAAGGIIYAIKRARR